MVYTTHRLEQRRLRLLPALHPQQRAAEQLVRQGIARVQPRRGPVRLDGVLQLALRAAAPRLSGDVRRQACVGLGHAS